MVSCRLEYGAERRRELTSVLVTNDDGYDAPGILTLARAMRELGDVEIIAPATNQSQSGHKITLFQDLPYSRHLLDDDISATALGGSPADCIAVAMLGLIDHKPDIVVSGINRGENMGQDLTYSGTVTAALEASIQGLSAVAVSLSTADGDRPEQYQVAAKIAVPIVRKVLEQGLPPFTILNVNVPGVDSISQLRGIRLTRQGVRVYRDSLHAVEDGVVRVEGDPPVGNTDEIGTDLWAVHRNYVSITPVHLDMTAHQFMANLEAWDLQLP